MQSDYGVRCEYEIRPYEPHDKSGFLSLYTTVFGEEKTEDWFAWKYEDNPYIDDVPVIVAVHHRDIVGARPLFALKVGIGDEYDVTLQPADTMVHPDHRRQGLFTRMTEHAIERYAPTTPFFFNFPNRPARRGYLQLDWQIVSERPSYYRIEHPDRVAEDRNVRPSIRLACRICSPVVQSYYHLRDELSSVAPDLSVRTERNLPIDDLADLYRASVPEAIHVVRDEEFYEWRFNNPDVEYTTYVVEDDMGPQAAIVSGTSVGTGSTISRLTDVVPLQSAPRQALLALIDRILRDPPESDMYIAPCQGIHTTVLRRFGFHADSTPPLSLPATQTTHVVRSLTTQWERNGVDITDPNNWVLTFAEDDTG